SSRVRRARPVKFAVIGPSLILIAPSKSLAPRWRTMLAPGRHVTTRAGLAKKAHTSATGRATEKLLRISMVGLRPPRPSRPVSETLSRAEASIARGFEADAARLP